MPRKSKKQKEEEAATAQADANDLEPSSEDAGEVVDDHGGQARLPEMERRGNKAIEKAMEQVKDFETKRMDFGKKEKEAREFLIGLMNREQITKYEYDGMTAKVNGTQKVSVRTSKDDLDGAAEEEDWEPEPEETQDDELAAGPDAELEIEAEDESNVIDFASDDSEEGESSE